MFVQSTSKTIETGFELKGPGAFLPGFSYELLDLFVKILERKNYLSEATK